MGLFGRDRKKDLQNLLDGLPDDYRTPTRDYGGAQEEAPGAQASAPPDQRSGLHIGGNISAGGFVDRLARAQALMRGNYAGAAQISNSMQDNALAQQKYAEQQAQVQQAQQSAYAWAKSQGYSEVEAHAVANKPEVVASLIQQMHAPQHFGADGGSIMERNSDGSYKTTIAPSERQIGRNVFRFGGDGAQQQIHSEVEPQSVPGVGLYGWDGTKGGIVDPRQTQQPQQPPQATGGLSDEEITALEGGSGRGPKTFRPRRRLFGSY